MIGIRKFGFETKTQFFCLEIGTFERILLI